MGDLGIGQADGADRARAPERTDEDIARAWQRALSSTPAAPTQSALTTPAAAAPAPAALASAPQATPASNPNPNPNANMHISAAGLAALRAGEGQVNGGGYYNDSQGNCTRGTGLLVHRGHCSPGELARPVDQQANERDFQSRVSHAEAVVRRQVPDRPLTPAQFDALVSATFNLGASGAQITLDRANHHDDAGLIQELRHHVGQHVDAHGHLTPPSRGLERRRDREAAPFEAAPH